MTTPPPPEQIKLHRDRMCRRDENLGVESAVDADRFIENVGFKNKRSEIGSQRSGFGFQSSTGFAPQHSEKGGRRTNECSLSICCQTLHIALQFYRGREILLRTCYKDFALRGGGFANQIRKEGQP